uniref:Uncharacterized protein n=1 Tax=Anguilla anguilla TaxID=7936 RepID=A0A0E9XL43_ANGAN
MACFYFSLLTFYRNRIKMANRISKIYNGMNLHSLFNCFLLLFFLTKTIILSQSCC